MVASGEALEVFDESGGGEGAGGEDGERVVAALVEVENLFPVDGDAGIGGDAGGYPGREFGSVDCKSVAGGDRGRGGVLEEEAVSAAHLLLEEPGGGVFGLGLEGVRADEFGEVGGLVGFGRAVGAHFVEVYGAAERGGLEGGLRSGEAAADDFDFFHWELFEVAQRFRFI